MGSPANSWYRKHGYGYMTFEGDYDWLEKTLEYMKPKQEQPEVDLEKEIEEHAIYMPHGEFSSDKEILEDMEWARKEFHHFYGLRNSALEEAARHVYESWMGSTMDDVRRDIVELGKVLNEREGGKA
jgi:hypothetical protein